MSRRYRGCRRGDPGGAGAALALWRAHARAQAGSRLCAAGSGNGERPLAAEVAPDRIGAHNVYHVFDLARWSRQGASFTTYARA